MQPLLFCLYGILFLSGIAVSSPIATSRNDRSFTVNHIRRRDLVPHGPTALRKAYRKFNIKPIDSSSGAPEFKLAAVSFKDTATSPGVLKAAASSLNISMPNEEGSVNATSAFGGALFLSPVTIGKQSFTMEFDTGSSDFWVFHTGLPEAVRAGHTVFNPEGSSSFQWLNDSTFRVSYGDHAFVAGAVGTDTVTIGKTVVSNQAIGLPMAVSREFISDDATSGIVGLGFSNMNSVQPTQQKTFFDRIAPQLEEPVMTASLKSEGVGCYEFGVIDQTKYSGEIVNISVDPSLGYWQFNSAQFYVGNGNPQQIKTAPTAMADTGTSLMLVSPEVATEYYKQVKGAVYVDDHDTGYVFPCDAQLPSLAIAVGDSHWAVVPSSVLNYSPIGTNSTTNEEVCLGGIQSNHGSRIQVFGDTFLKSLFVIFDQRGPSIGLASPAQGTSHASYLRRRS